jgi:hypothetical protein
MDQPVNHLQLYYIISAVLVAGTLYAIARMWSHYYDLCNLLKSGTDVQGKILSYREYASREGIFAYINYEFLVCGYYQRRKETRDLGIYSAKEEYPVGGEVTIRYLQTAPHMNAVKKYLPMRISEMRNMNIVMIFAPFLLGLALFIVGYVLMKNPQVTMPARDILSKMYDQMRRH